MTGLTPEGASKGNEIFPNNCQTVSANLLKPRFLLRRSGILTNEPGAYVYVDLVAFYSAPNVRSQTLELRLTKLVYGAVMYILPCIFNIGIYQIYLGNVSRVLMTPRKLAWAKET